MPFFCAREQPRRPARRFRVEKRQKKTASRKNLARAPPPPPLRAVRLSGGGHGRSPLGVARKCLAARAGCRRPLTRPLHSNRSPRRAVCQRPESSARGPTPSGEYSKARTQRAKPAARACQSRVKRGQQPGLFTSMSMTYRGRGSFAVMPRTRTCRRTKLLTSTPTHRPHSAPIRASPQPPPSPITHHKPLGVPPK